MSCVILNAIAKKYSGTCKKVERSAHPKCLLPNEAIALYTPLSSPPHSLSFSASPSSRLRASCIILQSNCTRTDGRPVVRATPRAGSLSPSDRPFKPFIFLPTCTRMNPYPGVHVYENQRSPWADPIFSLMTHCPREQLAPRTWIAYRPRIHDVSEKLVGRWCI